MPLVKMKELLQNAEIHKYCVGAFSVINMETIQAAIKCAEDFKSPIIIQIAEIRTKHAPLYLIGPMMIAAAKKAKVPVAVHLDHGENLVTIKEALDLGFTSVMFDGSDLPLEENITKTNEVVNLAKKYGATVEAEIGVLGKKEDGSLSGKMMITETKDAIKFYSNTNVDALAIAIGNSHGMYTKRPNLQFDRLKEISEAIKIPIVLHGGSGISAQEFKKCIHLGVNKINIATLTLNCVIKGVKELFIENPNVDFFTYQNRIVDSAYDNVQKHMRIFDSINKA